MIPKKPVPNLIRDGVAVFGIDHAQIYQAFWQCVQVPVISTTDNFGAKPVARAAALRLCATGAAGISPTEPQRSQIRNATIAAASWSWAQARYALRLSMRWTRPFSIRKSSARYTVIGAGRGIALAS